MATIILGATSIVGSYLLPRLQAAGETPVCLTRDPERARRDSRFRAFDPDGTDPLAKDGDDLVSLIPLFVLAGMLGRVAHARRILALGSTSIHTKAHSDDPQEAAQASAFVDAETDLVRARGMRDCLILRPTLIYDCVRDKNVTAMARLARRWGIVPIAAPGSGLRQPVHADDVAAAVEACLGNWDDLETGRAYDLPGTDTITFAEMAARVARAAAARARVVAIPVSAIAAAMRLARLFGSPYTVGAAARMNRDQAYDGTAIWRSLQIEPRPFRPAFPPSGSVAGDTR